MKAYISNKMKRLEKENPGFINAVSKAMIDHYDDKNDEFEFEFNGKTYKIKISRKRIGVIK